MKTPVTAEFEEMQGKISCHGNKDQKTAIMFFVISNVVMV